MTGKHLIRPTSPSFRRSRQPEPGRRRHAIRLGRTVVFISMLGYPADQSPQSCQAHPRCNVQPETLFRGSRNRRLNDFGDPSSMRRCIRGPMILWPRRGLRSPITSAFTTHADRIPALTGKHLIRPTSPRFRRSRQPEPGRRSTYPPKNLFRQAEPPLGARQVFDQS